MKDGNGYCSHNDVYCLVTVISVPISVLTRRSFRVDVIERRESNNVIYSGPNTHPIRWIHIDTRTTQQALIFVLSLYIGRKNQFGFTSAK